MEKRGTFMESALRAVLLIVWITAFPSVGAAEEGAGSWLDAWRDAVGLRVSDPTPVFGDQTEDEKGTVADEDRPRKRFVSPAAADADMPGETDTVTDAVAGDAGTAVDSLDPDASPLNALIGEWLRIAEPPINATGGARAYYDEYGRMLGRLVGAVARADRKPDDVGGRSSREYVWSLRGRLDSVDHCTLEEYVAKKIAAQSTSDCRGRYKPAVRDVVGMTKRNAGMKLSELGLNAIVLRKSARSTRQSTASEDDMIVESTDPPAGTAVERKSTVYIVLREPPTDEIAKAGTESGADANPFDGDDNSWIDVMRGREGRRSERNVARSQIAAVSSSSGDPDPDSGGRAVFTSDDLLDDLEKMTGNRGDTGDASAAVTATNVSGGNEPTTRPDPSPAPEPADPVQPQASTPSPEPRKPSQTQVSTPDPEPPAATPTPFPSPDPEPQKPIPTPTPVSTPSPVTRKPTPTPTPAPAPTATPPPQKPRTITWNAPALCEQNEGAEYRWRWMVSLKLSGAQVTGDIYFHKCPGGGRLSYRLTGEEQKDGSFVMRGTKSGGRGGLYGAAPYQSTFTLREGRPPSPLY